MASPDNASRVTIDSSSATVGPDGEVQLVSGEHIAMRMWRDEQPTDAKPAARRTYETIGYVISGRAELHLNGQVIALEPGISWVVPHGAEHTYRVIEAFTAVEVTHPSYHVNGRG